MSASGVVVGWFVCCSLIPHLAGILLSFTSALAASSHPICAAYYYFYAYVSLRRSDLRASNCWQHRSAALGGTPYEALKSSELDGMLPKREMDGTPPKKEHSKLVPCARICLQKLVSNMRDKRGQSFVVVVTTKENSAISCCAEFPAFDRRSIFDFFPSTLQSSLSSTWCAIFT